MAADWTGTYTWRVENWTRIREDKVYSPAFEIGGYSWRLLAWPRGDNYWRGFRYISVYLYFPAASCTPPQLCPKAKFEVLAVRGANHGDSLRRETTHTFSSPVDGFGFAKFISRTVALNPRNGYLVDDTLTLRVNILLEIDGILGMTSKAETGFMGLKSLDRTSLLSSFLLCLYHIKIFRKAVYKAPIVESDDPQESLLLALQHLFYKLKYQNTCVETENLIQALSCDCTDMCLQHDVLEMQRILFGKLSEEDQTGSMNDCMSKLFKGQYSTNNESPTIPEAPMRKESYMGIALDVLECKDIYASLEKFCQNETLSEDNQHCKTSRRLFQSKRYTSFDCFPTVLQLNLKRCHYNPDRNALLKINSHFEFYDELDLDRNNHTLLSKDPNRVVENKYKLYSVIVHADGLKGGRYYTYIQLQQNWYKFDCDLVKTVSAKKAINAHFGDQTGTANANFSKGFKSVQKSAAVTLIYIRKSEWESVVCSVREESIPKQITNRFDKERVEKEELQNRKDAHLYVHIKLATELHFAEQIGNRHYFGLANFDGVNNYRLYKKTLFEDFREMVNKDFGIPKYLQRFWLWNERTNNTMRVSEPLVEGAHDLKTVWDLRNYKEMDPSTVQDKTALMTINLFLESPEGHSSGHREKEGFLHKIQQDELLIFFKHFDPISMELSYLGHLYVKQTSAFQLILEQAKKLAGISGEDKVIGFKELMYLPAALYTDLVPESTPTKAKLFQGDTIIIQKVATNRQYGCPTNKSFLEFTQCIKTVNFRSLEPPTNEGFEVELLTTMNYEQLTTKLAKHLQVDDPKKLRLTQHNIDTRMPHKSPIKYNGKGSFKELMFQEGRYTHILYYEVLDMQLGYLDTLKCLTIGFHSPNGERQSDHKLMLPRGRKVCHLVKALRKELGEDYIQCDLRVMLTRFSKVYKVLDTNSDLTDLRENRFNIRAEVIPEDQKKLKLDEFLVLSCHGRKEGDFLKAIGDPLWVKVKKDETVRGVKVRIQKTLKVSDEEFSQWRIAYHSHPGHPVEYLRDRDNILAKFPIKFLGGITYRKYVGDDASFIVLEHQDARHNCQAPHH